MEITEFAEVDTASIKTLVLYIAASPCNEKSPISFEGFCLLQHNAVQNTKQLADFEIDRNLFHPTVREYFNEKLPLAERAATPFPEKNRKS